MTDMLQRLKRAARALRGKMPRPLPAAIVPEDLEQQVYAALIQPGDSVFDVGANRGQTALCLARLAGESGIVYAFEPVLASYRVLCRTVQSDFHAKATVVTLPFGLADFEGIGTITFPFGLHELGAMTKLAAWSRAGQDPQIEEHRCRFLALDSFVRDSRVATPQFLKIDVEGAELQLLRGALQFLTAARPLMHVEMFSPWEAGFGYGPADVFRVLEPLGYRFLFVCPEGVLDHQPTEVEPFPPPFVRGYNVIACPQERHRDVTTQLRNLQFGSSGVLPMRPPPRPNEGRGLTGMNTAAGSTRGGTSLGRTIR